MMPDAAGTNCMEALYRHPCLPMHGDVHACYN